MAGYDEEIRVAIVANADQAVAGTAEAAKAVEGFQARVAAAQNAAAAAYAESQQVYTAALAESAQLMADAQTASVAQTIAAYDALNIARDASLANAEAYIAALGATQVAALNEEDFAAAASASAMIEVVNAERAAAESAFANTATQLESAGAFDISATAADADSVAQIENATAKTVNRGATIGLAQAIAGLARGNIGMASYGLARMGIASRALTFLMSPLGLVIVGVTAALGGLAAASIIGADDAAKLNDALLATNNEAGLTEGQLQRFANTLATGDTTIGDARQAILDLAQSGRFTGTEFKIAAQSVVDFATLTGQNTQQAAKYVEQLATATTQQLLKANGQYHFLSVAQFTYIENLRKEGKELEAERAIMEAWGNAMHTHTQQAIKDQGYLVVALKATEGWFSKLWDDAKSWGAPGTIEQKIASLQATLAAGGTATDSGFIPYTQAYIASINAQIAALKKLQAEKDANAQSTAAANNATQDTLTAKYGTGSKAHHVAVDHQSAGHRTSTKYAEDMLRQDDQIIAGLQRTAQKREEIEQQVNSINESAARNHAHAMLQVHLDGLRTEEAEGKITHAQELADEKKLYAEEYAAQLAEYQKELKLEQGKPVEIARINAEILALQDKHMEQMAKAAETSAQKQAKAFKDALAPISDAFSTSINGIIRGTQTMQQAIGNMLDSILLKYLDVIIKGRVEWVAGELQKTAATVSQSLLRTQVVQNSHLLREAINKADVALHITTEATKTGATVAGQAAQTSATVAGTAIRTAAEEFAALKTLAIKILTAGKTIAIDAAEAGAAVFKALAGLGPFGLALAAAGAATAIYEVKSLAHFDVGAWSIPHDMPAMVHQGETILPRPFAEDFRSAMSGRGNSVAGGASETHYHIHANDAASFHDMLQRNPEALAAGMRKVMRTGAFA